LGANRELILLYWNIGNVIIENSVWGNKFIDNLARDIKLEFPNAKGYSVRNLKYLRKFAEFVADEEIVQTLSAQLSWSHNSHLLDKSKSLDEYGMKLKNKITEVEMFSTKRLCRQYRRLYSYFLRRKLR